ncbi:MAG: metal ABC transporter permease [Candidatus Wallbacteria bacterium]|nr:metal ABC transporter permease [Candidatus Wallbacteria bacterium]
MSILEFEFFRNALAAGLLVSIACGILGTFVVVNRLVFIAGGIAHAAYGGVGLALYFGFSPVLGTFLMSILSSLFLGAITLNRKSRSDTVIGVFWAAGMAMGVILTDLAPGYNVDLMSFLFGSILSVSRTDLVLMAVMTTVIALVVAVLFRHLQIMSYDEDFAKIRGIRTDRIYLALLLMIGVSVVMTIRIVGLILVIALLTIPTYIAESLASTLKGMILYSSGLAVVFTVSGLVLSYRFNLTTGPTIIAIASLCFALFVGFSEIFRRYKTVRDCSTAEQE